MSELEITATEWLATGDGEPSAVATFGALTLGELRAELYEERSRPSVARECRWQALAGLNPGEAPEGWLDTAKGLADEAGPVASDEVFAVMDGLEGDLASASGVLAAMRRSTTTVDLRWATAMDSPGPSRMLPWERGAEAASRLRAERGLGLGPLEDRTLEELLSVGLPLPGAWKGPRALSGGFQDGVANGRTAILVPSRRPESQRFYLARLIGCALASPSDQHLLPVTSAGTALQKFERSFAQELLCPWAALDAFTDENGIDDEGVAAAAEQFHVSERLVQSTLVNRGKLSRERAYFAHAG